MRTARYIARVYDRRCTALDVLSFSGTAEFHNWRTKAGFTFPTSTAEWCTIDGLRFVHLLAVQPC
jgi:hypothetical protein